MSNSVELAMRALLEAERSIQRAKRVLSEINPAPAPQIMSLRDWREHRGLSQKAACQLIGVSRVAWINYEHGRAPVPKTVWLAISAVSAGLA